MLLQITGVLWTILAVYIILICGVGLGLMLEGVLTPLAAEPLPAEPTGASLAWTSQDPAVVRARELLARGQFAQAESELKSPAETQDAPREMVEIIRRLRQEYSLSAAQAVARFQESIPGTTLADLERWRQAGEVNWRMIDGTPMYFRREPANILRFCGEAKQRRGSKDAAPSSGWTLPGHLQAVITEGEKSDTGYECPVKHRMTYRLTISPQAPGLHAGATLRIWLPFPQEQDQRRQAGVKLLSSAPASPIIAPSQALQRTAYFEQKIADPTKPLAFSEVIEFTSTAYYPNLTDLRAKTLSPSYSGGNLAERPPHIVFTPALRAAVTEAVGDATDPFDRARRIYRWIGAHIAYHAEEEYGVIPSISAKALACRRGDCGIQATLFITMCRCAGIPARWQSGWESKPSGYDMHDWAEFYIQPESGTPLHRQLSTQPGGLDRDGGVWLPCDVTYAQELKDDPNPKIRDFYCGHIDSYRIVVNRDYGAALRPTKQSLRSDPFDCQRGEVEIDGRNLYFNHWNYDMQLEWDVK